MVALSSIYCWYLSTGLYFWHDLQATGDGAANCTLTVEYYNRMVSGWEPWIEPWKCQLHWQQQQKTKKTPKRLLVKLDGCLLMFRTITTTPSRVIITNTGLKLAPHDAHGPGYDKMSEWREVAAGEEIPFEFSSREKMRHKGEGYSHDFGTGFVRPYIFDILKFINLNDIVS
ncbi:predicted protein [Nematostella vectensis]|uniref:Uncharacterized protein n=1 Tax=Nematostella vectensis TaxID=45351 RepID=A7T5V7_NEMVE|nr:predicted protein [Nematostella vectensis]|eukprot:XP_001620753.1 hypothetical protein NEMVEDRAFT_v1g222749 [Nematostella vectensis]